MAAGPSPNVCGRCGAAGPDGDDGDSLPLGWSLSTSRRGVQRLCDRCTREHVRDIEAKLDEEWWG
ncbi:MAG: hypothetical protein ACRDYW_05090 [Acidimicrobiales bacterium]